MSGLSLSVFRRCLFLCFIGLAAALPSASQAQTLAIHDDIRTFATLTNTTVTLTGRSELRITGTGDPLVGCVVHLNSPDSMLLLTGIVPSTTASTFLGRVRVDGAVATAGGNVRVVQYANGTAVIPHSPDFAPLEVFDGRFFTGSSRLLSQYTAYNNALLGDMAAAISSFKLKRGYMATFATNEAGTGFSRNYVAQDGDLEISLLPATMDNAVRFVRVFPWRWVSKKGIAGNIAAPVKAMWWYNWNLDQNSPLDREYVAIRHTRYWPGLGQNWQTRGVNHLLGYNEPDHVDQANMTVAEAISSWPDLLGTGLRVGSPAPTDGGLSWLYSFMTDAATASLRVDFVAVHYYRSYSNASDPAGATTQFYNFLKGIHDQTGKPIWITEWNNGANWTSGPDPTAAQQQATVAAMIDMLDNTPWVERYALYNWVEDVRRLVWDDGSLTAAGVTYRDNISPLSYFQELPDSGTGTSTRYSFDGHSRDMSGSGLDAMQVGAPVFVPGRYGQAIQLDGTTDYLQITPRTGDNTDFTFAGWVNWGGGGDWQRVFDFGEDNTHYFFVCPKTPGGNLRFAINTGSGEQQISAPALTAGVWTHVAVTISGDTGKLFVNGVLAATNAAMTFNPVDVGTKYNYIGKSRFAADPLFNGRLDDLRFISSALSDAQISAIANTAPPQFVAQTIWKTNATPAVPYSASLAADVVGGAAPLTFAKMDGPTWLTVSAAGALAGTPATTNSGVNNAMVKVTDANGAVHTAMIYITVLPITGVIADSADDAEESATGAMSLASTDLELVNDGALGNQIVGLRFSQLFIPQGAVISSAVIQFTADEAQSEATLLDITAENADDSAGFTTTSGNLSSRTETSSRVQWSPAAWATIGEAAAAQATPNIAGLVQQVVSRPGWAAGNALTILIRGTGHRTADSFEKASGNPPRLIVSYTMPSPLITVNAGIALGENDAEQSATGVVALTSADLELVNDGALGNQTVGLRFERLAVPFGAIISSASIQFTADEAQNEVAALTIRAQAADNAPMFTTAANNLGARSLTAASAAWAPPAWTVGDTWQSPDLTALVGEVVSRPGWAQGNSIAFLITGTGHRTADAAEKVGGLAPVLSVTYRQQLPVGTYEKWAATQANPGIPGADPDGDGTVNLIEYAFGLNPMSPSIVPMPITNDGTTIRLNYTLAAQAADVTCTAEWSDTLASGSWSTAGVNTYILSDNGTQRTMQAVIPAGTAGHRYVRLRVVR